MTRNEPQTPTDVDDQASAEVAEITDKQLLAQFAEMAVAIPADPGGGTEAILERILSARTWEQLNEPWETSDVDDILGKQLRLTSVVRRPSTYRSGVGVFLVVKMRDPKTGKDYVKTTGSVAIVGQLAWLYFKGATTALIEWKRAERPTEAGYYPQHLKVIDAATPGDATT